MTASRFTDHMVTGIASARPAANAVPQGAIYFATDTLVISKSDGVSAWTTMITAGSTDATLPTTDITTNNATSSKHGFAPKSPADAAQFLNGAATAAFAAVKDSDLSTSDITTNNASTSKHGLLPKLDNTATHYLDGTGAWSTPAGGGGGYTSIVKASDESVTSSNTLQDDNELVFTGVSGGLYIFIMSLIYASPAGGGTPDIRIAAGEDTTLGRGVMMSIGLDSSDSTASSIKNTDQGNAGVIVLGTGTAKRSCYIHGSHLSAGGTFKLKWAQFSSDGSPTIVYAGSTLLYMRVF